MDWTTWVIVGGVVVALVVLKRLSLVGEAKAKALLKAGARVIDVRTPAEFRSGQVPGAINIPLNELSAEAPRQLKDKSEVLLVHCLSGGRSGLAKRILKQAGYTEVYNLGSFGRANRIVAAQRSS